MSIIEDIQQLEAHIDRANAAARSDVGQCEGGTSQYWSLRAQEVIKTVRRKVSELEVERYKTIKLMLKQVDV